MTFTVHGTLANGTTYVCWVGSVSLWGKVSGTDNVMELLLGRGGEQYAATPTGPFGKLDCGEPETVLGALLDWTHVTSVVGDVPDILGGQPEPGAVF